ncbi:MAG: helix-hairpin-helix domain-containing protein [Candidatus Helarchaeota archaeon]
MDKEKNIEELLSVEGIDKKTALKLNYAGIRSISELELQDPQTLSKKIGYPETTIKKWLQSIAGLKKEQELRKNEAIILNLKEFLNISYEQAKILRNVGVFSIDDLINEDPDQLAEDAGISVKYIKFWISKAKKIRQIKSG